MVDIYTCSYCGKQLEPRNSISVQAHLPRVEGSSQGEGTVSLSQLSPRRAGSISIPFFFPFYLTQLCGDLPCNFGHMRSSASILQIFCENYSTCKHIYDVFLEAGEFHVLLFHHLDFFPLCYILLLNCSAHFKDYNIHPYQSLKLVCNFMLFLVKIIEHFICQSTEVCYCCSVLYFYIS